MMQSDYPKAAAFTGHRFIRSNDRQRLKLRLESEIAACYHSGIRYFLCGMAIGFDMLAAETLLAMKADYPDIQLTAVLPFSWAIVQVQPSGQRAVLFHSWQGRQGGMP